MDRKEYNRIYYLKNREKLLEKARHYHFSNKKPCPICGKLISREAKKCVSCTLRERNKSEKQRKAVSEFWRGRFRSKELEEWYRKDFKLTESEVKRLDDNLLRPLGWILTDGYIRKRWGTIVIYQTKERGKEKIRKLLSDLHLNWKEYEVSNRHGETMFYISPRDSRMILERLALKEKKLPDWVKYLSREQTKILLEALIDGDGHRGKYYTYLSGKYERLKPIFKLLVSKGISCSLTTNKRGDSYIYIHQGQLQS